MKEVLFYMCVPMGIALFGLLSGLIWTIISLFQLKDCSKENRMGVMWIPLKPVVIFGAIILAYIVLVLIFYK